MSSDFLETFSNLISRRLLLDSTLMCIKKEDCGYWLGFGPTKLGFTMTNNEGVGGKRKNVSCKSCLLV